MKMIIAARLADAAGQLTHSLRHHTSLKAHMTVAHLALDLCLGH